MKKHSILLMVLLILAFSASSAPAAFSIPSDVYGIDQLQQATQIAIANNKQIVFLYSNKDSTCPLASKASINIMQRFKNSAIIVYICKQDKAKIPRIVRDALKSPEAGKYIPKTVVVDSGIKQVAGIIPYERPGR